jgi:hypothetical protein
MLYMYKNDFRNIIREVITEWQIKSAVVIRRNVNCSWKRRKPKSRRYLIMPGRNRTGPEGMGPMTGRGLGYCSGYSIPGGVNPTVGRGYDLGFGYRGGGGPYRGRQWFGYGYGTPFMGLTRKQEREILQEQAAYLEDALKDIKQRIGEIEKEQKTK